MSLPLLVLLALAVCGAAAGNAKRGLTVEDLITLHRLGGPVVSPDGKSYVYTETEYVGQSDRGLTHIMYGRLGESEQETNNAREICPERKGGLFSKGNPTFLDNTHLLFTSGDDAGVSQVYLADLNSLDKCEQMTHYPIPVDNLIVHDEGNGSYGLFFSAEVYVMRDGDGKFRTFTMEETNAREDEIAQRSGKWELYTDGYIRHWDQWLEQDKWSHLFYTRIEPLTSGWFEVSEEAPLDITKDVRGDVPMKPFGDRGQVAISPDGTRVAYVTQDTNPAHSGVARKTRDNPSSVQWTTNDSLYIASFSYAPGGAVAVEMVTADPEKYIYSEARAAAPVWRGDYLYFLGMKEAESESDTVRLVRVDMSEKINGKYVMEFLTEDYDFSVSSFLTDDDKIFWLTVSQNGYERIVRFDSTAKKERVDPVQPKSTDRYTIVTRTGAASSLQFTADGRIMFGRNTYMSPMNICLIDKNVTKMEGWEAKISCVTNELENRLGSNVCLQQPYEFFQQGASGDMVQSFYFYPCGYSEANKPPAPVPTILYVHGGPESPWSDDWSYRWNPQVIVAQGYAMVLTNFHGSSSFGDRFTKSIRRNWYSTPFEDVKDGLRWMIEKGIADPTRIGAMGASYGGTFMNWLNGHNDPFVTVGDQQVRVKVIITHDGIFDLRAFGYDTDETFFPSREFGGFPEDLEVRKRYEEHNPANFTRFWNTPALVIQGGFDFRIATNHGLSVFQSLKMYDDGKNPNPALASKKGVDAQFLYFPTQSHWVWQPQESVVWHNSVVAWLATYLKSDAAGTR